MPSQENYSSDDESPMDISNKDVKNKELEKLESQKQQKIQKSLQQKEKNKLLNERLVKQSEIRKSKAIEKANLLSMELLEAAKEIEWEKEDSETVAIESQSKPNKKKIIFTEAQVGPFNVVSSSRKSIEKINPRVLEFKIKTTTNSRVKRVDILSNLPKKKRSAALAFL